MHYHHISSKEKGQSLVEYALILVLVAVILITVLTLFGNTLQNTYCRIVYQVVPGSNVSQSCKAPFAIPNLVSQGPNHINIEVKVHDPDGNPNNPYAAITQVEFYIDNTNTPVHTEYFYRYCLGGAPGANPCNNYSTSGLSTGSHTIIILAYDSDGNVGRASYKFTK